MGFPYENYMRMEHLPHIWCAGCGHGTIAKALIRAIDRIGWDKDSVVMVSGIGCASRLPGYVDFNTLHTTHGRALPFATGVKLVKPELHIVVVAGDGDALAIGGNHFIHACRRNMDMTLVVFNNYTYGMTGGQRSPSTPVGAWTSTTPFGNPHPNFDTVVLAQAAGASYVARSTTYHVKHMENLIYGGLKHKGFAVIEVMEDCPTNYGRKNHFRSPVDMLKQWKDVTIMLEAAKADPEKAKGKIPIGLFLKEDRPDFQDEYSQTVEAAKAEA